MRGHAAARGTIAYNKHGASSLLSKATTVKQLQDLVKSASMEQYEVLQRHTGGAQARSKLK